MLVLWGARSGDVQVGSREDRDAQPPWPGVLRFLASLEHAGTRAGERFRLEPRQEEAMRAVYGGERGRWIVRRLDDMDAKRGEWIDKATIEAAIAELR